MDFHNSFGQQTGGETSGFGPKEVNDKIIYFFSYSSP